MFASASLEPKHSAPGTSTTGVPLDTTRRDRLAEFVHHLGDVPMRDARRAVHHCEARTDDPLSVVAAALLTLRREAGGLLPA